LSPFLLGELGAEGGRIGDAEDVPQELLFADGALVGARVDVTGEVRAERTDAGELAARDLAAQLPESALVVGCERAGRDARRRRLDRRRRAGERERGGEAGHAGGQATELVERLHVRRPPLVV
jgi:hypothetical protein